MPHIKVKPFELSRAESLVRRGVLEFRAQTDERSDELWAVTEEGQEFLLHVKPQSDHTLIKYDKITRPLRVSLLKKALRKVAEALELDILSSNIAPKTSDDRVASVYEKSIKDFEEDILPDKKIRIEVGFGSGRHLLYQAQKHPDRLFIGLEIHTPSAQQVLKQIALQELDNIWVVNYDARLFLEMLPSNTVERIYVHFPVPWDKKPHRRVISEAFNAEAMRVLEPGGELELRTDSDNYFSYALSTFLSVPKTDFRIRKNADLEVTSKYEARWRRMQKDIYDVYVKSLFHSEEKKIEGEFNFDIVKYKYGALKCLKRTPIRFERFFVHIERVYRIGEENTLLKCSFGSFDRPEHKYIVLGKEEKRYVASPPVKTAVNLNAHIALMEIIEDVHCH